MFWNRKLKSLPNSDISEFDNPEVRFELRVLNTLFLKQASGLFFVVVVDVVFFHIDPMGYHQFY